MFGMSEKLKPCPFCGREAEVRKVFDCYEVVCNGCYAKTDERDSEDEAIESWNNRPSPWHTELPSESGDYVVWCCDHMALGPGGDPSKGNRLCIASYNSESETFINEYDDEMGFLDVKTWWGQKIEPSEEER